MLVIPAGIAGIQTARMPRRDDAAVCRRDGHIEQRSLSLADRLYRDFLGHPYCAASDLLQQQPLARSAGPDGDARRASGHVWRPGAGLFAFSVWKGSMK